MRMGVERRYAITGLLPADIRDIRPGPLRSVEEMTKAVRARRGMREIQEEPVQFRPQQAQRPMALDEEHLHHIDGRMHEPNIQLLRQPRTTRTQQAAQAAPDCLGQRATPALVSYARRHLLTSVG